MNPFKIIGDILTTLLTLLFLGWGALFFFRLGFTAHTNPFLYPLVVTVMGEEQHSQPTAQPVCYQGLGLRLGQCDTLRVKPEAYRP